jgi:DNA-binding beta-propeller fold protein YncE
VVWLILGEGTVFGLSVAGEERVDRVSFGKVAGRVLFLRGGVLVAFWVSAVFVGGFGLWCVPALAVTGHGFGGSFGGAGSGEGEFLGPAGVAVDQASSVVYVVDSGNDRVEAFDGEGVFLSEFGGSETPAGSFSEPSGVAVDNSGGSSEGRVYVVDQGHHVIDEFEPVSGGKFKYVGQIAEAPIGEGGALIAFPRIDGVAVDSGGGLWFAVEVEVGSRPKVVHFDGSGAFVGQFESPFGPGPGLAVGLEDGVYLVRGSGAVAKLDSSGETGNEEVDPGPATGLAVSLSGEPEAETVYIDDGVEVAEYSPEPGTKEPEKYRLIQRFGDFDGKGHLVGGAGIAVDSATGDVYVADAASDDVDIFVLASSPPAPDTEEAGGVTSSSATLHGKLAGEPSEEVEFNFAYEKEGAGCTGEGETRTALGTAMGGGEVSGLVEGLEPSTSYTFCLVATNEPGSTTGSEQHVLTLGVVPAIDAQSSSGIAQAGATLEAQINPFNQETSFAFEYSTSESLAGARIVEGGSRIAPRLLGDQPVSAPTGVLAPNTTYYYRAVAENQRSKEEAKPAQGATQSLLTLPATPSTGLSSAVTTTGVTLAGTLAAGGAGTHYYVEYGPAETPLQPGVSPQTPAVAAAGGGEQAVSVPVSGLQPDSAYRYRVIVGNATGVSAGAERQFRTLALAPGSLGPILTTDTSVLLGVTLSPEPGVTYTLQYGATEEYGQSVTVTPTPVAGEEVTIDGRVYERLSVKLEGLNPGETYHYTLLATNGTGSSDSPDATFTTNMPAVPSSVEPPGFSLVGAGTPGPPAPGYTSFTGITPIPAPETVTVPLKETAPKPLTRAQKLANALKVCRGRSKRKQAACERRARTRYGSKSKAKAKSIVRSGR